MDWELHLEETEDLKVLEGEEEVDHEMLKADTINTTLEAALLEAEERRKMMEGQ